MRGSLQAPELPSLCVFASHLVMVAAGCWMRVSCRVQVCCLATATGRALLWQLLWRLLCCLGLPLQQVKSPELPWQQVARQPLRQWRRVRSLAQLCPRWPLPGWNLLQQGKSVSDCCHSQGRTMHEHAALAANHIAGAGRQQFAESSRHAGRSTQHDIGL